MISAAIGHDLGLGILYIVTRAMGCFFGCFRGRDSPRSRRRVSDPVAPCSSQVTQDAVPPGDSLGSMFGSHENEGPPCDGRETQILGSLEPDNTDLGLQDEAKFLKGCGTLLETPVELCTACEDTECSPPHDGDSDPSEKFHSWFPNTSFKKLSVQLERSPTPAKLSECLGMMTCSSEETPSSCVSDGTRARRIKASSNEGSRSEDSSEMKVHAMPSPGSSSSVTNLPSRSKVVRFECDDGTPSASTITISHPIDTEQQNENEMQTPGTVFFASEHPRATRPLESLSASKPSPYPTPLKLNIEMQTPGTVFPASQDKHARIRSQYVYSVLNPVENFSQWRLLKEGDPDSNLLLSCQLSESTEHPEKGVSKPGKCKTEELNLEASLKAWLKPSMSSSGKKPPLGRTPGSKDELSLVFPHQRDGNGIPNSTNKYKEDQKVRWHATPFEERLEKALSEENCAPHRRRRGKVVAFDETEEYDAAALKVMSVASFR